ncbi:FimB/Mfa2 family fimbrial subunit [Mucilaginibacter ginsenosidivorans]|nr:FimB/Mfa2 family fimbrial subunit [Mucilaginibacter ginsenosidivorans]
MKKYIYSALAILIGLSSCKKEAVNKTNSGKLVNVSFNLSYNKLTGAFNVTNKTGKLSTNSLATTAVSDTTIGANATVLYVGVYQSDGSRLFLTKQLATDTAFGKVNYNLPAGNYTFVFVAGQTGLNYDSSSSPTLSSDFASYSNSRPNGAQFDFGFRDTFFQKVSLTIDNTGISQNINLKRITGQIVLNIEDAIPANVKYLIMYVSDANGLNTRASFSFNTAAPVGVDGDLYVSSSVDTPLTAGQKNRKLAIMLVNAGRPHQVRVIATDRMPLPGVAPGGYYGQTVANFTISDVPLQANHKTILSGKLFGGNGTVNTGGFQVTVDPTWDPTITTIPFQ